MKITKSQLREIIRKSTLNEDLDKGTNDPCWKGYVQLGTKQKDGREVPNCVPMKEAKKLESIIKEIIAESRYKDDPRWIRAKFAGTDANGRKFKRGDEILYYPKSKTILTGKEADKEWKDFESIAQDDDWMNSQFR